MSDGSVAATRPGHRMPAGADPKPEAGFVQWVSSILPTFAETSLGDRLVEEGFDSVHDAHLVTVEMLRADFGLKSGHAAKFVEAAREMQASLAMTPVMGEVVPHHVRPLQVVLPPKRALAPPVPVATGTVPGCGVGGLATAAAMTWR